MKMGEPTGGCPLPHCAGSDEQRRVRRLRRGRRLPPPRAVGCRGLGLTGRQRPHPTDLLVPGSGRLAAAALRPLGLDSTPGGLDLRQLVRGQGVLPLRRATPAERAGVGDGRRRGGPDLTRRTGRTLAATFASRTARIVPRPGPLPAGERDVERAVGDFHPYPSFPTLIS